MPRRHGSRAQARPLAITHACFWPGCPAEVGMSALMCRTDWARLPTHLRNAWINANKSGSAEAVELARAGIASYARREVARCS
jgi:hypothetical protein